MKIKVPEGMLGEASHEIEICALFRGATSVHAQPIDYATVALEAAMLWLSENPIVPNDEFMHEFYDGHGTDKLPMAFEFLRQFSKSWQRRMFLAPEPEPKAVVADDSWHPMSDKPAAHVSVLISDPPESPCSSRCPTRGLAHVNNNGEWCTMHNGKPVPINSSHLRDTKWRTWPVPPPEPKFPEAIKDLLRAKLPETPDVVCRQVNAYIAEAYRRGKAEAIHTQNHPS